MRNFKLNGGLLLIISALAAIILANSQWAETYFTFWQQKIILQVGDIGVAFHGQEMTLMTVVNDLLMTIFFLAVGLEIKREVLVGELSSPRQALFPVIAALGGMALPVLTYVLFCNDAGGIAGAPISMATDIAFSLGVLSLFGKRVPVSLKVFLTTLAVADDIGGIIVIAIFYSSHISYSYLLGALIILLGMYIGGHFFHFKAKFFYIFFGMIFWALFVQTGIHPTIAGVLMAFTIPARPSDKVGKYIKNLRALIDEFPRRDIPEGKKIILSHEQTVILKKIETASDHVISPLQDMEDSMHGLVSYFIMPVFAFANAGVMLGNVTLASLFSGVTLAVALSLIIGKFIGIFSFSYISDKLGLCHKPDDLTWKYIAGVSVLGGIGFTVSLFIANLSFPAGSSYLNDAKLGIVLGSVLSGVIGYYILNKVLPHKV